MLQHAKKGGKIRKLKTFNLSYFLGETFFADNNFQNLFVYQPTASMVDLKEHQGTE